MSLGPEVDIIGEPVAVEPSEPVVARTFCHRCEKQKVAALIADMEVVYNGQLVKTADLPKPVALVVNLPAMGEGKLQITVDPQGDEHRWCPGCGYLVVWRKPDDADRSYIIPPRPIDMVRGFAEWEAYESQVVRNPGIKNPVLRAPRLVPSFWSLRADLAVVRYVLGSALRQRIDKKLFCNPVREKIYFDDGTRLPRVGQLRGELKDVLVGSRVKRGVK